MVEAVQKRSHYLYTCPFTLITGQQYWGICLIKLNMEKLKMQKVKHGEWN